MSNKAENWHERIIAAYPIYEETAHWIPVACSVVTSEAAADRRMWADSRGLKRGTKEARNDYLIPVAGLWLFKDPQIAMEFKMLWG
jgi:hypothetical protein